MALPTSFYSMSFNDNTLKSNGQPESSNCQVPITTLTPANVAATETLCGNLLTAIGAITLGQTAKHDLTYSRALVSNAPSDDPLAQRENKWLVRFIDATTSQKASVSIPTADLSKLANHSEFLNLAAGDGLAFKTAFEAVVASPFDASHAVTVVSVQFVGRNS